MRHILLAAMAAGGFAAASPFLCCAQGDVPDPNAATGGGPAPAADAEAAAAAPAPAETPAAVVPQPAPPETDPEAEKIGNRQVVVWAMPGHASFGVGQYVAVSTKGVADDLRARGFARLTTDKERADLKKAGLEVHAYD